MAHLMLLLCPEAVWPLNNNRSDVTVFLDRG
jgi:hypothetical protein